MTDREARLHGILGIGQSVSMRGNGISLREALKVTGYAEFRSHFTAADLQPIVAAHPEFTEQWLSYSEDKRTTGGWYIRRDGRVGRVSQAGADREFATMHEAVAEFVVLELDFWAHVRQRGDRINDNPYAPPTAPVCDSAHAGGGSRDAQHRGWALTSFLLFVGLTSLLTIAFYAGLFGLALLSALPAWMVHTFLIVAILRLIAAIAIWYWLRLGVVLYAALTLLALPIALSQGYRSTALSPLGVALLVYLVRRKWSHMRWNPLPPNSRWSGR